MALAKIIQITPVASAPGFFPFREAYVQCLKTYIAQLIITITICSMVSPLA